MGKASRKRRERMEQVQQAREIQGLVKRARFYDRVLNATIEQARMATTAFEYFEETGDPGLIDGLPSLPLSSNEDYKYLIGSTVIDASALIEPMFFHSEKSNPLWLFELPIQAWGLTPIRCPFEKVFIDVNSSVTFSVGNSKLVEARSVGIHFESSFDGVFLVTVYVDDRVNGVMRIGDCTIHVDDQGLIIRGEGLEISQSGDDWENNLFIAYVYGGLYALQFLNCRNIVTIDHEPDPADNAAYQRHFGVPMTTYKTLAIKPMGKQYERDGEQKQFDVMPLHIRRGNFAHYTDDAPLFGKYTGTFWRPATAVGNAKNGIRVKDYEVKSG